MKKSLLAAAVLSAVSFGAYADGVELYGIIDLAVANVSNAGSTDGYFPSGLKLKGGVASTTTTSLTAMVSGGIQGSRWGIKGSEDLGDGMKAMFQLESGIQANDGAIGSGYTALGNSSVNKDGSSINGQLFGRTAWVGLSDKDLGAIKFGRQYSVIYDVYNEYDPVQFAAFFSPAGNSGSIGGGGITELSRQDNSVKYNGKTGDVSYTAMYKFGNTAGSSSAGSVYGAQLAYKVGHLGLTAAYQSATDAVTASSQTAAKVGNVTSYILGAKYKFNDVLNGKVNYQRVTFNKPSDAYVAGDPFGYTSYYGNTLTTITNRSQNSGFNVTSLGGDYKFNEKLALYVGYFVASYDANGGLGLKDDTSYAAVTENYTSLLLDYNLSKRTDVYLGGMQVNTNRASYSNVNVLAVGLRTKF